MDLEHVRAEIERMRVQVNRQRKEILQLQCAGRFYCLGRTASGPDAHHNRRPLRETGSA